MRAKCPNSLIIITRYCRFLLEGENVHYQQTSLRTENQQYTNIQVKQQTEIWPTKALEFTGSAGILVKLHTRISIFAT